MTDSRCEASRPDITRSIRPSSSRAVPTTGWSSRVTRSPRATSSSLTESTRKGESSVFDFDDRARDDVALLRGGGNEHADRGWVEAAFIHEREQRTGDGRQMVGAELGQLVLTQPPQVSLRERDDRVATFDGHAGSDERGSDRGTDADPRPRRRAQRPVARRSRTRSCLAPGRSVRGSLLVNRSRSTRVYDDVLPRAVRVGVMPDLSLVREGHGGSEGGRHGAVLSLGELDRSIGLPRVDRTGEHEAAMDRAERPGRIGVLLPRDHDLELPQRLSLLAEDLHDVVRRTCREREREQVGRLRPGPLGVPPDQDRVPVARASDELETTTRPPEPDASAVGVRARARTWAHHGQSIGLQRLEPAGYRVATSGRGP